MALKPPITIDIYNNKSSFKLIILALAVLIGSMSLWYTNRLVAKLADRERKMIDLYAKAMKSLATDTEVESSDQNFLFTEIVEANTTIPVLLTDDKNRYQYHRNFIIPENLKDDERDVWLNIRREEMAANYQPIVIELYGIKQIIYYDDSQMIKDLRYYPLIQLGIIGLFGVMAYLAVSASRRAEQNRVWVGLAKETAHQLGTPLSSLIAWVEFLRHDPRLQDDNSVAVELEKDVKRLETITARFSSIGSVPAMVKEDLVDVVRELCDYLQNRVSKKIQIRVNEGNTPVLMVPLNKALFEWVIENLVKNAVDAIGASGRIDIDFFRTADGKVGIDVSDSGKGMTKLQANRVFQPGFTTKKRGWGLGLTLAKRIIENYHQGKIYVKSTEPGKGTIFRIILKG